MIKKFTLILLSLIIVLTGVFAFNIEADSTGSITPRNWPEDEPASGPIKSDISIWEDDPSLVTIEKTTVGYRVDNSLLEVDYTEHGERVYSSATGEVRASNIDIDLQMYSGKRWISVATPSDIVSYNNTVVRYYEGPYKTSYRTVHTAYVYEEVKLDVIVDLGVSNDYRIVWTIEGLGEIASNMGSAMAFGLDEANNKADFFIDWTDVDTNFGDITSTSYDNGTFEAIFDLGYLEANTQITLDPTYIIDTAPTGTGDAMIGHEHGVARTTDGRLWSIGCMLQSTPARGAITVWYSDDFGQNWVAEEIDTSEYPFGAEPDSRCYASIMKMAIVAQGTDVYVLVQGNMFRRRAGLGWMGAEVYDSDYDSAECDAVSGTTKGELHVVYTNQQQKKVSYVHRNSDIGGWDAPVLIQSYEFWDGVGPSIALNDIGDIFVMWASKRVASPSYYVAFRWYDASGSTWTAVQNLSGYTTFDQYNPPGATGGMTIIDDYLYAVYYIREPDNYSDVHLRRFHMPTNTWDTDFHLVENTETSLRGNCQISSDLAGDLWVTYYHQGSPGWQAYRRHRASENITTWDATVPMEGFTNSGWGWIGGHMDDPRQAWSKADVGFVYAAGCDVGATQYVKYYTNSFYTTDYPDVRTDAASSIDGTSATLNSYLIDDGGDDCRLAFDYDLDSGEPYEGNTTWTGYTYGNGSSYNDGISGLNPGDCYYFVAKAENSLYADKGDEESFITLPLAPTSVTSSVTGGNRIQLTWVLGSGADSTYIVSKNGSYPADRTDGDVVYSGAGTSYLDTDLDTSTTYYYRLWSWATESCGTTYGLYGQTFTTTTSSELPWVTTVAATSLGSSTATLNGLLNWDGDQNCQYRFTYGNVSGAHSSSTSWTGSINTDDTFSEGLTGLLIGETYYFTAQAKNTYGVGVGSELSFTLAPAPPEPIDGVTGNCTPGDHKITLTWTKGGGASETHIRYSLTSYPTSLTSGDEIYEGTASTYEHLALENGVTVYYTLWGKEGDEYSPTYTTTSCAPGGSPSVITVGYTHLSMTEVRMHGYLSEDGGGLCDVRFEYDTGTGAPYSFSTTWVAAVSDDEYYADLDGLSGNSTYYFRAHALSGSTNAYGAELNFSTYESLMAPTNFVCYPITDTQIELSWTLGYGSSNTLIRYKTGSYSTGIGDGTEGYFGPDASTVINNLTPGQTYYFSAWGEDGGLYSGSVALSLCTASGQPGPDVTPTPGPGTPPPDAPPNWWTSPSCDKVDGLPGFGLMENFYNHFQIPSGTMCMGMALLIITILGVGTFVITRGHILAAMIVVIIAIGLASTLLLIPGWVMLVMIIVGGGLGFVLYKLT